MDVLSYDPLTGVFTWRVDRRGGRSGNGLSARAGDEAGSMTRDGYMRVGIDGRQYALHRVAWLYMTGDWPAQTIDHRDTVKTNNRWSNLRDVSSQVNTQNQRRAQRDNLSTGLLGVALERSAGKALKFRARICVNGRNRTIGMYATPEEAHAAYVDEKRKLHDGCTL